MQFVCENDEVGFLCSCARATDCNTMLCFHYTTTESVVVSEDKNIDIEICSIHCIHRVLLTDGNNFNAGNAPEANSKSYTVLKLCTRIYLKLFILKYYGNIDFFGVYARLMTFDDPVDQQAIRLPFFFFHFIREEKIWRQNYYFKSIKKLCKLLESNN